MFFFVDIKKKIVVVGVGLVGLVFFMYVVDRGYEVYLYDKVVEIGG